MVIRWSFKGHSAVAELVEAWSFGSYSLVIQLQWAKSEELQAECLGQIIVSFMKP
jgi:hypothetical protein